METLLQEARRQTSDAGVGELLDRILATPRLHARLINSLSRMEYVGARKMVKARHTDSLNSAGLQHLLEEVGHALRLKRAAIKINGGTDEGIETYSTEHTMAGNAGEGYLQGVDRGCEGLLDELKLPEPKRSEVNYVLSSLAIEVRAEAFYPIYEEALQRAGAPFSVRSILSDELRHLEEMTTAIAAHLPEGGKSIIDAALKLEDQCFRGWITALRESLD
jgi:hypothetical protein